MSTTEIKFGGFGGQGVILAGIIVGRAASIYNDKFATLTQSFGPEARGSACSAQVIVSDSRITYPYVTKPEILLAMSQEACNKFLPEASDDATVIIEEDLVKPNDLKQGMKLYGIPATRLAEELGLPHISSGELFRENIKAGTPLGKEAQSYIDRGELVPDEVTIAMVAERLGKPDSAEGAILDGFPRTIEQALALDHVLAKKDASVALVPYINADTETLLERLGGRWTCRNCQVVYHILFSPPREPGKCDACGGELYQRPDDTPATHRKRIEVYQDQTAPLIEFYRERGLLVEINGEADIEGVHADLLAAVERSSDQGKACSEEPPCC